MQLTERPVLKSRCSLCCVLTSMKLCPLLLLLLLLQGHKFGVGEAVAAEAAAIDWQQGII